MAFPIKHDFKDHAFAMVRGRVINALARVCSFWAHGNYINVHKPSVPTGDDPIRWDLDVQAAAPAIAHEFHAQDLFPGDAKLQENAVDAKVPAIDTQDELAAMAPVGDIPPGAATETATSKIERIGTSERAAREDHRHPVVDNGATKTEINSGFRKSAVNFSTKKTDTWTRGVTKSGGKPCGFTIKVLCRMQDDGTDGALFWRLLSFDECGRCYSVAAESDAGLVTTTEDGS